MPLLDMPLEQLKRYTGSGIKPEDFDRFWADSLEEARTVVTNPRIQPRETERFRNTLTFDVWFDAPEGGEIYAKYLRPKRSAGKLPVILAFHGYGKSSASFFDLLSFAGEGYIVLAMDCRGQGGRSRDGCSVAGTTMSGHLIRGVDDPDKRKLYYRNVFLDTVLLTDLAGSLPDADKDRIYVFGDSQGGGLALACAALCGSRIKKAVVLYPYLCDYQRIWAMDLAQDAYECLCYYIRSFAPEPQMQQALWEKLAYIDIQHLADRIQAKVLWSIGLLDSICPPSAQFAVYNKIRSQKEMVIFSNHGHEGHPTFHPGFMDKALAFLNT